MRFRTIVNSIKKPYPFFITGLILVRIILANWVGIWFPANQIYDDALLVSYTNFTEHFQTSTTSTLLKYLGYPVYLKIVSITPFSYATCTALLWVLAAVGVSYLAYKLVNKRWFYTAVFIYVLFMPLAFESWAGTRLYRNSILAPCCCISLTLMILSFLYIRHDKRKIWKSLLLAALSGIAFTFTYYNKEDGIWLLVCLLFSILLCFIQFLIYFLLGHQRNLKSIISAIIIMTLPLMCFKGVTNVYKNANEEAFGVTDLNTRTDGELGHFVSRVYKIESEDRDGNVWAPYDAIEKAYNASPTFQQYPELLESIHNTAWYGNIEENPIQGDFLTWVLRTSLDATQIWKNEKQVSDLFAQINKELDTAFENGTLKKQSGRIQLLSSAGGRTLEEIFSLSGLIKDSFKGAVLLDGYTAGGEIVSDEEVNNNIEVCKQAVKVTHTSYLTDYSSREETVKGANTFCNVLFIIYRIANVCLCALSLFVIISEIFRYIVNLRKKKTLAKKIKYIIKNYFCISCVLMILMSIAIGMLYAFGISWFISYIFVEKVNMEILNYYDIALPVFLMFSYLFTGITLIKRLGRNKKTGNTVQNISRKQAIV